MKIEIKDRDSHSYDEILALSKDYKKVSANPRVKVVPYSLVYFKWIWILLFIMLFMIVLLFVPECSMIAAVGLFVMFCFEIRMIKNYIYCKKVLKEYSEQKINSVIDFSKDKIVLIQDSGTETCILWDSIKYIFVNKYSIVFFQNNTNVGPVLGFSVRYIDDLLQVLDKYSYNDLLIDNRNLYK